MDIGPVALSFIILSLLLLVGFIVRLKIKLFQKFFIPASLIAGMIGLLLGPDVLGNLTPAYNTFSNGLFPESVVDVWKQLPEVFITIIFGSLFLGRKIYPLKKNMESCRSAAGFWAGARLGAVCCRHSACLAGVDSRF